MIPNLFPDPSSYLDVGNMQAHLLGKVRIRQQRYVPGDDVCRWRICVLFRNCVSRLKRDRSCTCRLTVTSSIRHIIATSSIRHITAASSIRHITVAFSESSHYCCVIESSQDRCVINFQDCVQRQKNSRKHSPQARASPPPVRTTGCMESAGMLVPSATTPLGRLTLALTG